MTRLLHICFLCNEYPPAPHGGIGSMTQTLGRSLAARGHRVSVVGVYAQRKMDIIQDYGVTIYRLPSSVVPYTGYLVNGARVRAMLSELHKKFPIDIVDGPELSFASISRSFAPRKIIRMNGGHYFFSFTLNRKRNFWKAWLERQSFTHADSFCAVSRFAANTTRDLLQMGNTPIAILPNPVDTDLFSPRLDLPEKPYQIAFSGTLCDKKGIYQLIEAFPIVQAVFPQAELIVNGRDTRHPRTGGSYMQMLKDKLPSTLLKQVHFKGFVPMADLPQVYASAAALVFPSHMETQGIVVIEGMAMQKSVIASETGPGPEIIADGINGFLCNPRSHRSIADRLVTVLGNDSLRSQVARNAREHARDFFSTQVLVEKNLSFYYQEL